MTVTTKIAHNTLIQIIGKVFSTLLGLLALGMMTRYLPVEQFGWYTTAITFLQFIGILVDFGLIPVTAQMLSEGQGNKQKLLKNLIGYRFVTAIVFLGIAPLLALFFPYPPIVKVAIAISTINFLGVAMNQIFIGFYQTRLKMHIQVIGENIGRIVLIIGLWFIMATQKGFLPVIGVITVSSLAYTAFLWIRARKEGVSVGMAYDRDIWKAITKKMWPIAISIIFNVMYLRGDTILLTLFRPQTDVAIYGAAYRVIDTMAQTAMMLMGVMLPLLTAAWFQKKAEEFKLRYQQSFDSMMLLAVPMVVGVLVLAKPIIVLVAGDQYAGSGAALRILAMAVFGVYLGAIFGHTAVALNKQKQTMWIYISDAMLTLVGYLIFIPKYGMMGGAWMTVFSELYAGVLLWMVVRRYAQVSLEIKTFAKILFSAIVMGAVLLLLRDWHVLILVVVGGLVYLFFILGLGAVSKQTIMEIVKGRNNPST